MQLDAKLQATADAALTTLVDNLRARQAGVRDGITKRYRQAIMGRSWGTWDAYKPDVTAVQRPQIDEYLAPPLVPGGPDVPGWSITAEVTDGAGVVWRRTVHVAGPETWRETAWHPVSKEAL